MYSLSNLERYFERNNITIHNVVNIIWYSNAFIIIIKYYW